MITCPKNVLTTPYLQGNTRTIQSTTCTRFLSNLTYAESHQRIARLALKIHLMNISRHPSEATRCFEQPRAPLWMQESLYSSAAV